MEERPTPQKRTPREILVASLPLIIFLAVVAVLTVVFWPYVASLATEEGRAQFRATVDSLGFLGWLVTLAVQLLQIFLAFIPGEPVELLLGVMWGPWLGTFTCLLGIFIGTSVIFLLVRRLGVRFVRRAVGDRDITKYKFLSDPRRLDLTVFILFFIPGTPKDALTYVVPLTNIGTVKYLLISTLARIPSVVTSTVLGDSLAAGDYTLAVIVFVITALISVGGIIFGNAYTARRQKAAENEKEQE